MTKFRDLPPEKRLGDKPVEPRLVDMMNALARGLDKILNGADARKNGFVLLVFPLDGREGQRCNFISNAERADVLVLLKEMVARFEGQPETSGRA